MKRALEHIRDRLLVLADEIAAGERIDEFDLRELAFKGGGTDNAHRIGTPVLFRDLLIDLARLARKEHA